MVDRENTQGIGGGAKYGRFQTGGKKGVLCHRNDDLSETDGVAGNEDLASFSDR